MGIIDRLSTLVKSNVNELIDQMQDPAKEIDQLVLDMEWEEHASRAVQAGDDALAKEALRRKAQKTADRIEAEKAVTEQTVQVEHLVTGLRALEQRVKEVKLRQGTLREKARAAKGQSPVSTGTSAFADFDRMSGKIDALEAEASLTDELRGTTAEKLATDRKLEQLSEDQSIDDALAALKRKLSG